MTTGDAAMKHCCLPLLCCLCVVPATPLLAGTGDVQVALKGGTLGAGAEVGVGLTDSLTLRGGANYLKFNFDSTIDKVDYNMEPELANGSLLLDWYPFANGFRLTGGVYLNDNKINVDGTFRKDLIPGEYQQYASYTDIVHVKGSVDFNPVAPYAGLGWTSNHGEKGWGIDLDLGVMFQGAPEVSELYTESPYNLGGYPEVGRFLTEQRRAIEDDLDSFQYYPVASITLKYNF
jgi:hypothetical protein